MGTLSNSHPDWTTRIATVGRLFNSTLVLEEVLRLVMDNLIDLTGADRGFVMLLNNRSGELEFKAARNLEHQDIDHPAFQVSRGIVRRVVEEGKPVLTENAATDSSYSQFASVAGLQLRSVLCAPLQAKGRTIGAVYVENRLKSGIFDENDLDIVRSFCDEAAIGIDNARLHGDLQARMEEIAAMKEYQDNIFRSVGSAIITLDLAGKVTAFNAAAERIFARSRSDATGRAYTHLFGDALAMRLLGRIARAAAPGGQPSRLPELHCDLPERPDVWLNMTISALWDPQDKPIGVVVVADDLTEAKALEEARRKADEDRQRVRDLFGKYVAPAVAERLLSDPGRVVLGGESQTVTVLFGDIRGYTTISEKLTPEDVVGMLNRYLAVGTRAIFEQEGTLDKYIGDAVMAFFNAPLPQPDHAGAAIRAAVGMQEEVKKLSEGSEVQVSYGIGVNTGRAIVGNIGTERLMNYTVIGDAVNVASRLQSRAPAGQVLISESSYQLARDLAEVEPLEPMQVKGRQEPVMVYRVVGLRNG